MRIRLGTHHAELQLAPGAVEQLPALLDRYRIAAPLLLIDAAVQLHLAPRLRELLDPASTRTVSVTVSAGKTLARVAMLADHADGCDGVIAVGGGTVGNLAGALAHVLGFGRPFVHVPTTLAAMVDAAVSCRHGLDSAVGKNALGVHHPPSAIIADPVLLATLPPIEWREGAIEALKVGLIAGGERAVLSIPTWCSLARPINDIDELVATLRMAIELKVDMLRDDPTETGPALALHYGHTLSRALETVRGGTVRHGPAVAAGMLVAGRVAERLGTLEPNNQRRHDMWIRNTCQPAHVHGAELPSLLEQMQCDPKAKHVGAQQIPMVLLDGLGAVCRPADAAVPVVGVERQPVEEALNQLTQATASASADGALP